MHQITKRLLGVLANTYQKDTHTSLPSADQISQWVDEHPNAVRFFENAGFKEAIVKLEAVEDTYTTDYELRMAVREVVSQAVQVILVQKEPGLTEDIINAHQGV